MNIGVILTVINILVHIECFVRAIMSPMAWFAQLAAKLLTLPTGEQDLLVLVDLAELFVSAAAGDVMLVVVMVLTMMGVLRTQVRTLQIDSSLE